MTVTPQSDFRQPTLISEDLWVQELSKKGSLASPLFEDVSDPEAKARALYHHIVSQGHSAEVWLGICGKEHTWGTNPNSVLHRLHSKSWGNTKSIRHPQVTGHIAWDAVRQSFFVVYDDIMGSMMDCIYRVDDPTYSYRNAVSIAEVIKIWAPAEDSNDPEGYAWWVANYVNGIRARMIDTVPGGDSALVPWIPADGRHHTKGRAGRDWPHLLIQHHTDGWDSLYWLTESPNSNVSATYLANHDGSLRAQLVRHHDTPHTTGEWNDESISMEWERKWSGTQEQRFISDEQYGKLADSWALIVQVEFERGNPYFARDGRAWLTQEQLKDHNDFYSTTCPGNLDVFRLYPLIAARLEAGGQNQLIIPNNPFGDVPLVLGFKDLFLRQGAEKYSDDPIAGAVSLFGFPEGPEFETAFGSAQIFERVVMKWMRGAGRPFDIVVALRSEPLPERIAA